MADVTRKPIRQPIVDRATALLAGPFLLGQRALGLVFQPDKSPGDPPPEPAALRISIKPPEHAIKRRG
ncbi:hypothetical protein GETHLI_15210 [Geothrix limicola]|uniref:Uncharacterized protein n=1 Tax=Geothrix limicola TaxID=2927978 RepID=A0ABQ5QG47_9BACT|nr:hypothetical protein [Geothrix limicola]GLH73019.1 hypothetical protein GETHLI_15210 [Geothrix limicola]